MPKRSADSNLKDADGVAAALEPFNVKKSFIKYFDDPTFATLPGYHEHAKALQEKTDVLAALGFPASLNKLVVKGAFKNSQKHTNSKQKH